MDIATARLGARSEYQARAVNLHRSPLLIYDELYRPSFVPVLMKDIYRESTLTMVQPSGGVGPAAHAQVTAQ